MARSITSTGRLHTDIHHSPDDGGWYAQQEQEYCGKLRTRVSKNVWKSHEEAAKAVLYGDVQWEKWY